MVYIYNKIMTIRSRNLRINRRDPTIPTLCPEFALSYNLVPKSAKEREEARPWERSRLSVAVCWEELLS